MSEGTNSDASSGQQIDQIERDIAASWRLASRFHDDSLRPAYHFMPAAAWMNDINGALFWKGRYHIFYQHNPDGGYWKWMQWGHASSTDLVHWIHHPIALTPDLDGPDRKGCYSGGAFVTRDGQPMLIYHGVPDGTCLATSHDDLLVKWEKHPDNPVIPSLKEGDADEGKYVVFDPCAWVEEDRYCALVGNRIPGLKGDRTALFISKDLAAWQFVAPFYEWQAAWTDPGDDCAVPDFFSIGHKWMLLFCSHLQGSQYYLGQLDGDRFIPDVHARLMWPGGQLGGPRSLLDDRGRRIFFDWVEEVRGVERERISGWAGVMTLPRVLSLDPDGTLAMDPLPELDVLRMNERRVPPGTRVEPGAVLPLNDVDGDCLEMNMKIGLDEPDGQVRLALRRSPDDAEVTTVVYDGAAGTLSVDVSRSTLDPSIRYPAFRSSTRTETLPESERYVGAQIAPFHLGPDEPLELRVYLDRSILEVFANRRQCITQRIYPTRRDSTTAQLDGSGGGCTVHAMTAWDMAPARG